MIKTKQILTTICLLKFSLHFCLSEFLSHFTEAELVFFTIGMFEMARMWLVYNFAGGSNLPFFYQYRGKPRRYNNSTYTTEDAFKAN